MKRFFAVIILLITACITFAQEVVSSAGKSQNNSGYEVSWTIGEPVIKTLSTGNTILTQGLHQTKLTITSIEEIANLKNVVSVFPNPTHQFAVVKFNQLSEQNSYKLYDLSGKVIQTKKIISEETKINLSQFAQGTYLLKIIQSNGQPIQTFKIIKQ